MKIHESERRRRKILALKQTLLSYFSFDFIMQLKQGVFCIYLKANKLDVRIRANDFYKQCEYFYKSMFFF